MSSGAVKQLYCVLTEKCNLNCNFCIRGNKPNVVMDYEQFVKYVLPEKLHWQTIILTGGEPLLHKRFYDILKVAAENFSNVVVASNGTIPIDIHKLKSFDLRNVIFQISIDGNKKTHEIIRGEDTYEKSFDTIRMFENVGINYCVSTVVNKNNSESLIELIIELARLKNLKYWKVSSMMPHGIASLNDCMTSDEWNAFITEILEYCPFKVVTQKLYDFDLYENVLSRQDFVPAVRNCGSGKNKVYVYPNLEIYPCTCLKDFSLGNLKLLTIEDAIKFYDSSYDIKNDSICVTCKFLKICNGGCPGMSNKIFQKFGYGDIRCPKVDQYYRENFKV